jgi:hypothetical protein
MLTFFMNNEIWNRRTGTCSEGLSLEKCHLRFHLQLFLSRPICQASANAPRPVFPREPLLVFACVQVGETNEPDEACRLLVAPCLVEAPLPQSGELPAAAQALRDLLPQQRVCDEWVASGMREMKMSAKDIERRDEAIGASDFCDHFAVAGFVLPGKDEDFAATQEIKEALDYNYDDKARGRTLTSRAGPERGQAKEHQG